MDQPWRFWIDRGGTFTDVVALRPDSVRLTAKLLSEDPHYTDAAVAGIRRLIGTEGPLPPLELRIGTTVATNALLERKGEPTCLVITRGHRDALAIGTQDRPELFARAIVKPALLYTHVVEADERVTAEGEIVRPLDEAAARTALEQVFAGGVRAVAIVLMHGYRYPAHELALAEIARGIGFTQISVSHQVAASIRIIGRGQTTVADAYLSPVIGRYVAGLTEALGGSIRPLFMQSSGGLVDGARLQGKDAVLSGPAGGIVGMAATGAMAGFDRLIGFDMGGTSTDVSHYGGVYERDSETQLAGITLRAPTMRIHTVAAGGGSICGLRGSRFTVGPESAGATPGPACYRRGGPLTVTDCNVALGKLQPSLFPSLFGPKGDQPLDRAAVTARFAELAARMRAEGLPERSAEEAAEGFVAIAVANMANAIKTISVQRGHDVTRCTLACFGGAGGQHACLVADALAIPRVVIHPLAGILSAYGMGLADRAVLREATLGLPLTPETASAIDAALDELGDAAEDALRAEGVAEPIERRATALLRYAASESAIEVAAAEPDVMQAAFEAAYRARFGYLGSGTLVVEAVRVEAVLPGGAPEEPELAAGSMPPPIDQSRLYLAGTWRDVPVYDRSALPAGAALAGPALVIDPSSTVVIEPGWGAQVDRQGNLILTRASQPARPSSLAAHGADESSPSMHSGRADREEAPDPVRLEIFAGLFMGLAEEMGAALQATAASVNIRERLDFSCAIFDGGGALVANAPHMPVHLGSMGDSIRAVVERHGRTMQAGDAYVLNAPYDGGTHLPDITVVMPVFLEAADAAPAFFVAARGHHADIGGISPGSMPPASRDVREEGVLIDNLLLVRDGRFLEAEMRTVLASGDWPARSPDRNIADLQAQVAACARGADALTRLAADHGADVVAAYMAHLQATSAEAVRRLLDRLRNGQFTYALDDGAVVRVAVTIDRQARSARVDFTGTSGQHPGNFNAPKSITRAAVLYVFRTLVDEAIPMNDGCLAPIEIIVPEGSMLNPRFPAAVVAGNVETSQVVTDTLFGALGAVAASQGTMNNFTFGNAAYQYYETIAGGAGAGPGFVGADVVQTHMTNSRLTDPEILETRFPVLLEEFSIRPGSGGAGRWSGGNGATRRVRFREAMAAGILANRRRVPPFGLDGGTDGAPGRAWVEHGDGTVEELGSVASAELTAGEVFVIETPGGGGYGSPR